MIRRTMSYLLLCAMTLAALTGCNVHEWPVLDFTDAPFTLHLDFSTAMPLYKEVTYTRADEEDSRAEQQSCDVRYIVEVYRTGTARSTTRGVAEHTFVFTRPYTGELDYTATLTLDEGTYDFYVWADYVDPDSQNDKYYDTSDFGEIVLLNRDAHKGSTERRDAFRGYATATVIHPDRYMGREIEHENTATAEMIRPMGRYEFISTDVELFLSRVVAMKQNGAERDDDGTRTEDEPTKAGGNGEYSGTLSVDQMLNSVDLNEFRVVFSYNAFMPCSFNMFTDKPADSWTGVSYESKMYYTEEGMVMGFDYILVNGSETLMNIRLDVYNLEGDLMASTPSVEVPIVRSKLTKVKGEFLTTTASGGVTVHPEFDGEYNIEIQ